MRDVMDLLRKSADRFSIPKDRKQGEALEAQQRRRDTSRKTYLTKARTRSSRDLS
jgi:hypothetical protein